MTIRRHVATAVSTITTTLTLAMMTIVAMSGTAIPATTSHSQ